MAKCPKCGAKLHWYDFRAECKHCGVNIPNYKWEERLENDADTAETSFAKLHYKMSNFKYGTIGSPLMIVRLVFTLLPLVALVVPLVKITLCFPFFEKTESVSFLTFILNYLTKYDIKASLSLMQGEALGGVFCKNVSRRGICIFGRRARSCKFLRCAYSVNVTQQQSRHGIKHPQHRFLESFGILCLRLFKCRGRNKRKHNHRLGIPVLCGRNSVVPRKCHNQYCGVQKIQKQKSHRSVYGRSHRKRAS